MLIWIQNNLGTIIIGFLLLIAVGAVVYKLVKDKKNGKSSCGCGCECCSMRGKCHKP